MVLASNQAYPVSIAVDAVNVYWGTVGNDDGSGQIQSVPIGGGTPTTLANYVFDPEGLAVDATGVYFADNGSGTVGRAPLVGPNNMFTTLNMFQPPDLGSNRCGLALGQGVLYWVGGDGSPQDLLSTLLSTPENPMFAPQPFLVPHAFLVPPIVTASTLYWADSADIQSMPLGGGPVTPLGTGGVYTHSSVFAVGPTVVAWSSHANNGPLYMMPLAGGAVTTVSTGAVGGIVVDEVNAYWTVWSDGMDGVLTLGSVMKAPIGGGFCHDDRLRPEPADRDGRGCDQRVLDQRERGCPRKGSRDEDGEVASLTG